jgi:sigma-E factor negative regulatory protein RseC
MCVSSESQEKVIEAMMLEPLQIGEKAEVIVREQLAWRAILLGYILPFIVMVAVIVVLDVCTTLDETISGTIALCSIAVYYLVLRLFRKKIQKHFSFTARKEN